MAFVPDANDPNAQPQGAQPGLNQPPQTATSSGGATAGSPQGSTAVPNATKAPPVQDLKAYLEANAPQAVQMGQNIAGNLTGQAQAVTGDINAAGQNFQDQVTGATVAPNPDLVSAAAANPTQFASDPNNVAAFQAQENAAYTGPTAFETSPGYSAINAEVNNATSGVPDITKPGGIDQLVRGQETNPTLGMQNLDTLLLQGNPDAVAPIQAALPQFATLNPQLASTATSGNAAIQDAIAKSQAAAAGVPSAFLNGPNAVVPTFKNNLNQELVNDQGQVTNYNKTLNDLITQENSINPLIGNVKTAVNDYNAQQAAAFPGLPNKPAPLTVADMAANPSSITNMPTLAGAATPQDIATEKALEALLGGNYSPAFDTNGANTFQAPGQVPTVKSLVDPIIQNLLFNPQQPAAAEQAIFKNPELINAIAALQKGIGEQPVTLADGTQLTPVGPTPGTGIFGTGMSVDKKTGQIIS